MTQEDYDYLMQFPQYAPYLEKYVKEGKPLPPGMGESMEDQLAGERYDMDKIRSDYRRYNGY